MTRLVLHGFALAVLACAATTVRADSVEVPEQTVEAAAEAGLDPVAVQGAANSVGVDARTYLLGTGELRRPQPAAAVHRVRLTWYQESGVTASGQPTGPGGTACSYNWAFGTRFRFPNGEVFTCTDRGRLGNTGWLDLWRRGDLARAYGAYVTVEVLPA